MARNNELNRIKKIVVPILKKNKIVRAGIFGSYARSRQTRKSDIDILVKTGKEMSLLGFSHLKNELEAALKKKVDLVEYGAIKPIIKDRILDEEIRLI